MANAKKERIDVAGLLRSPSAGRCQRCALDLTKRVQTIAAVSQAHVVNDANRGPLKICVHYDPARTTPAKVRATAAQMGAQVGRHRGHVTLALPADNPKQRLARLREAKGVINVDEFDSGEALNEFDPKSLDDARVLALLESDATSAKTSASQTHETGKAHDHAHGGPFGERSELFFALGSGAALAAGWLSERAGIETLPLVAFIGAYLLGGYFTTREAMDNLRRRQFRIDSLMLVAAIGAALLGAWAEGALLLFLFSLGHALENWAGLRHKWSQAPHRGRI